MQRTIAAWHEVRWHHCLQAEAASGGAGRKLLVSGRRLLATAADLQRRADVVFVGFVFMTLLDLGLLVLFGIQHPSCKQRSPRVYISGVDQGAGQQGSGKEKGGGGDRISLQVLSQDVTTLSKIAGCMPATQPGLAIHSRFGQHLAAQHCLRDALQSRCTAS